jgi:predicted DNA-binding transcriptional regulator AlpA
LGNIVENLIPILVRTPVVIAVTGLSRTSLWRLRLKPPIKVRVQGQLVIWNLPLLIEWLQLSGDSQAQERLIENYQTKLLSNQPIQSGRRPKK